MSKHSRTSWMRVPTVILLLLMLLPMAALATPPVPAAAQSDADTSSSPCTGATSADYNGQCGPSVAIPRWSDGAGWNTELQAGSIELVDLNGDGKDELVGLGPKGPYQGLQVHIFNTQFGQWVQAYTETQPLPFSIPIVAGSIRYGQLTEGVGGVVALNTDGSRGIETWTWNAGDGSIGSGSWTLESSSGPFSNSGANPNWASSAAYWGTIQFLPEPLEGFGYGLLGRGKDGITLCGWNHDTKQWSCKAAGDAFNDSVMSGSDGSPALYLTDTVQLADIYQDTAGPELFGLDNRNQGSLKVYTWDAGSQQFTPLATTGNTPFGSPNGEWYDVKYSSTIQPVQLVGKDLPLQVIGRSKSGLEYHSLNASGCGGHTPPCWKDLTGQTSRPMSDNHGYSDAQYYETIRFADLDGDGTDEVIARNPQSKPAGQIGVWDLHPNAGWYQRDVPTPALAAGSKADPLWSDPTYYETIQVGNITGAGFQSMVARGKYGMRTWSIQNGFARPQPYGFGKFSGAEQNAYDLVSAFVGLNPNSGTSIRTQYSAGIATTLADYATCLRNSLNSSMPPANVCATGGGALPNPDGVTAEQWQSMATLLVAELNAAQGLTEYIADVKSMITELYFADTGSFWNTVVNLFPKPPHPSSHTGWNFFNLFIGLARAALIVAGAIPGVGVAVAPVNAGLLAIQTVYNAMPQMQTPTDVNTKQLKIEEVQAYLSTTTAAALTTQTDIYQYIAADSGLLGLYGAMVNQGFWELTDERRNAITSLVEYHTSTWIYQTLTPLFWWITICAESTPYWEFKCHLSDLIGNGPVPLAAYATSDHKVLTMLVGGDQNGWVPMHFPVKDKELFERVFYSNASDTCIIGGTDPSTNWTNVGRTCNAAADITDVYFYRNGWGVYSCSALIDPIDPTLHKKMRPCHDLTHAYPPKPS